MGKSIGGTAKMGTHGNHALLIKSMDMAVHTVQGEQY